MGNQMSSRRFPAPWSVVDIPGGFRVQDASGNPLCYFYSWDEALHMAENFAKLPELLKCS